MLRQEEKEARAEGAGLWISGTPGLSIAHVEADAPGDDSASPNGEWVRILNAAPSPVQLTGHTLADEADHVYVFDRLWLSPGQSVRVHRGQGHNSSAEVYWALEGQSVWNNSGDTAYLRDPQRRLMDTCGYGQR